MRALWAYCHVDQPDWSNLVGRHAWQIFTAFPANVACVHFHTHPAASSNCIPHANSEIGVALPPLAPRWLVTWKRACKWYKSQDSRRQVPWQLFRLQTAAALASYCIHKYVFIFFVLTSQPVRSDLGWFCHRSPLPFCWPNCLIVSDPLSTFWASNSHGSCLIMIKNDMWQ